MMCAYFTGDAMVCDDWEVNKLIGVDGGEQLEWIRCGHKIHLDTWPVASPPGTARIGKRNSSRIKLHLNCRITNQRVLIQNKS